MVKGQVLGPTGKTQDVLTPDQSARFESWLHFLPMQTLTDSSDGQKGWGPATRMGDFDGIPAGPNPRRCSPSGSELGDQRFSSLCLSDKFLGW